MAMTRNLKPFPKGKSGNPGGRPKVPAEVREAARTYTSEALATLAEIMTNPKTPPATRVSAAQAILDRGWGRPQQSVEVQAQTKTHEEWLAELT